MARLARVGTAVAMLLMARSLPALSLGADILVPAVARVEPWVTDLYILNSGAGETSVTVYWLVRGQPNPYPDAITFPLQAGHTQVLEDVILESFGYVTGTGAFRVTAQSPLMVTARVFSASGEQTFGQGVEGIPVEAATSAGGTTRVVGLAANSRFRTNVYAVSGSPGATFTLSLRDSMNLELARRTYNLGSFQPLLGNVLTELGSRMFDYATLVVDVSAGAVVIGASKVDQRSEDPTTLESGAACGLSGDGLSPAGVYFGVSRARSLVGGCELQLDASGQVTRVELAFPSDRCGSVFGAFADFARDGVTLEDLARGITITVDYLEGGSMELTLSAAWAQEDLHLAGEVTAVGSGWNGAYTACNGTHPTVELDLGKAQP